MPSRTPTLPALLAAVALVALVALPACPKGPRTGGETTVTPAAPPSPTEDASAPDHSGAPRALTLLARHGGPTLIADEEAKAVTFSPDGRWLASGGGEGGALLLWDAATGRAAGSFTGQAMKAVKLGFSPDGSRLAASDLSRKIVLFDVPTRNVQRVLDAHQANVYSFTFSPDGNHLASLDADGVILIWDLTSATIAPRALASRSPSTGELSFSPDGRSLAAPRDGGFVSIWDAATGKKTAESGGGATGRAAAVRGLAHSPDGKTLISGETLADGSEAVILRDTGALTIRQTLRGHTGHINTVHATRDGRRVVSGSGDGTVRVWDIGTGQALQVITAGAPIWSLDLSPDGELVAAAGGGRRVHLFRTRTGDRAIPAADHEATIDALAFSPDGKLLASGDAEGRVVVREVVTGQVRTRLPRQERRIAVLRFSPDGSRLLSLSSERARFFDPLTGAELTSFPAGPFDDLTFSPDGRTLAAGDQSRIVRLLDASTGQVRRTFGAAEAHDDIRQNLMTPTSVSFSPDGKHLAMARWDQPIQIWDLATGSPVRTLPGTLHVAYSPRGDTIAGNIGQISKRRTTLQIRLWDASTGAERFTLEGSSAPHFSPDGRLLFAFADRGQTPGNAPLEPRAPAERELRLWSTATGQLLGTASAPGHRPSSLAIAPDGSRVATGGMDATVLIFGIEGGTR